MLSGQVMGLIMKDLIIIEAPGKLRKCYQLLDELKISAVVIATIGHLYDNPSSFRESAIKVVDGVFTEPLKTAVRDDVLRRISLELAQCKGRVLIASDDDREGHVIADDLVRLMESLGLTQPTYRLKIAEMTATGLRHALNTITPIQPHLSVPGHSRRITDRLITEHCSNFEEYLPVGRVQTAMLSLVEQGVSTSIVQITLPAYAGTPFRCQAPVPTGMTPAEMIAALNHVDYLKPSHSITETLCPAPDNTDVTLGLSQHLKLSLYDATLLMQQLYEEGKISYHRTSSHAYRPSSSDALKSFSISKGIIAFKQQSLNLLEDESPHEAIRVLVDPEKVDVVKPSSLQKNTQDAALSFIARQNIKSGIPVQREYANTEKLPKWAQSLSFTRSRSIALPWQEPSESNKLITLTNEQALFMSMAQKGIGTASTRAMHVTKFLNSDKVNGLSLTSKGRKTLNQAPPALKEEKIARLIEDLLSESNPCLDVNQVVNEAMLAVLSNDEAALDEIIDKITDGLPSVQASFKP